MNDIEWLRHCADFALAEGRIDVYLIARGKHAAGKRVEARPGLVGFACAHETHRVPRENHLWTQRTCTVVMVAVSRLLIYVMENE